MSLLKNGDGQARSPNLLGKAGAADVPIESKGILSQLEHGAAAPAAIPALRWRPGWHHWAAGALCLAVVIAAMLAYDTTIMPRPLPPAPATAVIMAPSALPAPSAPVVPPHAAQAATIVNTAGPPLPAAASATASAGGSAGAPRKAPLPARQAAARPQESRPAAAPGDSDVALLTAMVAHAHRQEGTAKPVRDVVLRRLEQEQRQEQETAELLRRCQQLGMIEGMLCRSRICSGRWDSDPACH
ncbi:hypothetical protein [Janthinobacterium sp. MDB2-8]|uniref:hypothetical protein n=1 Tax=Janthinobacterium sp. MDB2-8 TaxID=1259338 RepID=UPI003F26E030